MALDIPKHKELFKQRDIRETPVADPAASSTLSFITINNEASLSNERKLTTGAGIDFADGGANGSLVISCEDSTSGNKGIVIVAGGEGMDVSYSSGTATVIGEDSTAVNKGIIIVDEGNGINVSYSGGTATVSAESASLTNQGVVELSTILETQTGTSTTLAVPPNSLFEVLPPIGAVIAWLKSFANTPQTLPTGFVECNGQTLSDAESVYDSQALPDLNGGNRFLRGNSTSGGTGGDEAMAHTHTGTTSQGNNNAEAGGSGTSFSTANHVHTFTTSAASNDENRPPFYDMVWIMRIK